MLALRYCMILVPDFAWPTLVVLGAESGPLRGVSFELPFSILRGCLQPYALPVSYALRVCVKT